MLYWTRLPGGTSSEQQVRKSQWVEPNTAQYDPLWSSVNIKKRFFHHLTQRAESHLEIFGAHFGSEVEAEEGLVRGIAWWVARILNSSSGSAGELPIFKYLTLTMPTVSTEIKWPYLGKWPWPFLFVFQINSRDKLMGDAERERNSGLLQLWTNIYSHKISSAKRQGPLGLKFLRKIYRIFKLRVPGGF